MLKLPIFQPHEIESPAQMFRCEFYKATLAAGICIARQREPNIRGGGQEWMKRPRYEQCASGKCEQGNEIKARLGEHKPAESKSDRQRHERTVTGKALVAEIEKRLAEDAQLDETEKTLEDTAADPPPAIEPAPPAEEEPVEEEKQQVCSCGKGIRAGHDGVVPEKCFKCRLKAGEVSGRKGKPPRKAKAPTLADVAKKHNGKQGPTLAPLPSAPSLVGDDVVQLLEQKRQQHLDQAARIDKALSALRVG